MSHSTMYTCFFFFFNDTATTEIYTLSLHDALPIYPRPHLQGGDARAGDLRLPDSAAVVHRDLDHPESAQQRQDDHLDRKSTRLNSSHANISYAVFCLKKKKKQIYHKTYIERYSCEE